MLCDSSAEAGQNTAVQNDKTAVQAKQVQNTTKKAVHSSPPAVKKAVKAQAGNAVPALVQPKAEPFQPDDAYVKDRELLDRLQRDTFRYMWEHTFEESGLAYEDSRNKATGQATTGGTGFGVAAIVAAAERGWVSRDAAAERIRKIAVFLRDKTDRKNLHGAFPHWLDGRTGKTFSFSEKDDGADLVETAFLIQGLLIARSYFNGEDKLEQELRSIITELWHEVDWHWFSRGENNGLFWHWSPVHGFGMDMKISGFNEAMVVYVLALASPTHPISRETAKYWYSTHEYQPKSGNGYTVEAANAYAGCMFLSHYSFIGLDPRRMSDSFVKRGYMVRNTTHALMNRAYCLESAPAEHQFSEGFWGLTACDIKGGYRYQSAYNEVGTVAPTAALASMPYVPEYAMRVLWNIHDNYTKFWGKYGPYDAFSLKDKWQASSYLAIDQLAIPCMVENYRSGLLWSLFMNIPEVQEGLGRMGVKPLSPSTGFPQVVPALRLTDTGTYVIDALDLRRHPDSGRYAVPYAVEQDGIVAFALKDSSGKVLKRFTREAKRGDNVLEFEQFMPVDGQVLTLTMRTGDAVVE
ncbi:MAG: hypothetical protein IJY48_08285, partial [Mailhella sp.]|nr:hypothetical protein [Mailhella sp.]